MSYFHPARKRRTPPPDLPDPDPRPTSAWPWTLLAVAALGIEVPTAVVLSVLHVPIAAVLTLIGGASLVTVAAVDQIHRLLRDSGTS
ncbi:MAG TPA: hypothetical protein VGS97_23225 [Actinocrinis sp.]|uniref:hypothetical protein n=1 Tax=Actinocrinis sp. TaxID=1920516 RepID=UPI002DDCB530|nr:hypothetical protein [Actinocrinis sp.]HEV2347033.1 hypothetical protein [Actinocrinis sp.]